MKKWMLGAVLLLCMVAVRAAEPAKTPEAAPTGDWTLLQIGFLPGVPTDMLTVPVYGVKIGAPICDGAGVVGFEASVFYSASQPVCGLQGSLVASSSTKVTGVQLSVLNFVESCAGVQIGVFNSAKTNSFQIGLLNYIEDSCLPWFPIVNVKF